MESPNRALAQPVGGHADHSQIGFGIVADHRGLKLPAVGERGLDMFRAVDDMAIRENETIRSEDEARAAASHFAALRLLLGSLPAAPMADFDIDDGGSDRFGRTGDDLRIGIERHRFSRIDRPERRPARGRFIRQAIGKRNDSIACHSRNPFLDDAGQVLE